MKGKKHVKATVMVKSPNLGVFFRMKLQPIFQALSTDKMLVPIEATLSMRSEPSPSTMESPQLCLGKHRIKSCLLNEQVTKAEQHICLLEVHLQQ